MSTTQPENSIERGIDRRVERGWDEQADFGDENRSDVTAIRPGGAKRGSMLAYGWVALLIVASGVVNVFSSVSEFKLSAGFAPLRMPVLLEVTSAIAWILFLPLLRSGITQLRVGCGRVIAATWAVAATLLYAFAHLVTMVGLRKLLLADGYSFHWATAFPHELQKDVVSSLMVAVVIWLMDRKVLAMPVTPAPPAEALVLPLAGPFVDAANPGLWLRDGATSFRVDPRDIVAVTSAGNYVEFVIPNGRRLIRGTLAREEDRLRPFGLVRVHRARLVNLARVVAVEHRPAGDFVLRMDNGETIAGSKRYRNVVASFTENTNR
ncbi:LytTR family transcriptional regulator [Bradyrhizobium sp. Pear77]|uniref:LytTR family DNA-binding domain-containing protein n=1 Tax=Bradyrhizobium altum TaxID=1571202 RepID=UPI001E29770D|nr:LytTR family DNA-binding domain-containing protein [Bradyrhizobium altum]MCC8958709.1 LytTR family transcriptional regulator [Bradyrhizobium altum]